MSFIKNALMGLGYGVGFGSAYGTLVDILRTSATWAKWKAFGYTYGYPIIADVLQKLLETEKDQNSGLSPKGMVDTIFSFIDKTIDFAMVIDEAIASQLFVQMIQQSIAYAISSSVAGAIGTTGNVYSGSAPLSTAVTNQIGANIDKLDRESRAFLSAEVGLNLPSLNFELIRGANQRIEELCRGIIRDMDNLISEWNDLALTYYRHYHSMARQRLEKALEMKESVTERAYSLLEQVANEHLARISEMLDTLEGAKQWYDAGLMTEDELNDIALRIELERQASENNYDEFKTEILSSISSAVTDWDTKINQALSDMTDNEIRYANLIKSIFSTLFSDVLNLANEIAGYIDQAMEDVSAYRNVGKGTTPTVEINIYTVTVTVRRA